MPILMDEGGIHKAVAELARRAAQDPALKSLGGKGLQQLALVGIRSRGEILAQRIAAQLAKNTGHTVDVGALDITMYRDDLVGRRAITIPQGTEMNFRLDDKIVVLVDDVLHTGRSARAALDALVDFGRPKVIRLAVLVDRGGHEYPIAADYAGLTTDLPNSASRQNELVVVKLRPTDSEDSVSVEDAQ